MLKVSELENGIRLEIKVQPRSSKNHIVGEHQGALKVKLTAPPVDGEANKALVNFLANLFKIPKKNVTIIKGESTRNKIVDIKGIKRETLFKIVNL